MLHLNDANEAYTAAVYDIAGKEILPLFSSQHISDFDLNISAFSPGLYFIKVMDETGRTSVVKLIKD